MLTIYEATGIKVKCDELEILIVGETLVYTKPWQICELSGASVDELSFGTSSNDRFCDGVVVCGKVSNAQLDAFLEVGKPFGDHKWLEWLYNSVLSNVDLILGNFELAEDGVVSMPEDARMRYRYYVAADASFHSLVASAKKFLDEAKRLINKYCGCDSEYYQCWCDTTAHSYDNSLVYALMYDLRNRIEHQIWTISLVNLDLKGRKAGLAINVTSDLLNLDLKKGLKNRLIEWSNKRLSNGENAWLSLGKCVKTYEAMIRALYLIWHDALIDYLDRAFCENYETLSSIPGDYLIWTRSSNKSCSTVEIPRAYQIPEKPIIDLLRCEQNNMLNDLTTIPEI